MKVTIKDDFDLQKIADSGQCFRFNKEGDGYSVFSLDKHVFIKQVGECEYEFDCTQKEFDDFWYSYFDLDTDYRQIRGRIDPKKDPYLFKASIYGEGIRILRQDPFEMLISFIISQRKNIPAIKASIEKLCRLAGKEIGKDKFSFPRAEDIAALSVEELSGCSLGYRDKYVLRAAEAVAHKDIDLFEWEKCDDKELMDNLLGLYGVGVKVANCEILFGYHRLDAFPRDVWINRVLENRYQKGFDFERYAPYNGVMQQYLFFYSRNENL